MPSPIKHTRWYRVLFHSTVIEPDGHRHGVKTHAVPGSLLKPLLAEMATRKSLPGLAPEAAEQAKTGPGEQFEPIKEITDSGWFVDFGGMVRRDEPKMELKIGKLVVGVRTGHVGLLRLSLIDLKPRNFPQRSGTPLSYYKLHHWFHCWVMTPMQLFEAKRQVAAIKDEAEAKDKAFWNALEKGKS